jgi:hypothetical protein
VWLVQPILVVEVVLVVAMSSEALERVVMVELA